MSLNPWKSGLAGGWQVEDAATFDEDRQIEADVVVVGSGAGGGVAAETLSAAGLAVVIVEEGPLKTSDDFRMREADAYPQLYQESAARKTKDKAINILQGRCVGGSTTVNWTASFRTPPATLDHWRRHFALDDYSVDALAPWFERMETRLGIETWQVDPNANNRILERGAAALGWPAARMRRNVRGCGNLGYCGMGCPLNAKQSMLVTTIPAALERRARLLTRLRAQRLAIHQGAVVALECCAMDAAGLRANGKRVTARARHYVLAGGAINTPALLLRSNAPDPHGRLGARTFLHPTVLSAARFDAPVRGDAGAPQSRYSDHFLETPPAEGPIGFKLEVPPIHPVLVATTLQGFGPDHAQSMRDFANTHAMLALLRDGFHAESPGGRVELRSDGTPLLDYPLGNYLREGMRRAWLAMAELQFAAGAREVLPMHARATPCRRWSEARSMIDGLPVEPHLARVVSAHAMGGCAMAADPAAGVVDGKGRHFQLGNVTVADGSLFPTGIGANPQLSIYAMVARNMAALAKELAGPAPQS